MTTTTTPNRIVKEPPASGPWDWRSLLPRDQCELDDLRLAALKRQPEGISVTRWAQWVEAEMHGRTDQAPRQSNRLARYRRLLYELVCELVETGQWIGPGTVTTEDTEREGNRDMVGADNSRCTGSVNVDVWALAA